MGRQVPAAAQACDLFFVPLVNDAALAKRPYEPSRAAHWISHQTNFSPTYSSSPKGSSRQQIARVHKQWPPSKPFVDRTLTA